MTAAAVYAILPRIRARTGGGEVDQRARRRPDLLPLLFLSPSIAMIVLVVLAPLLTGFNYSLHSGTMLRAGAFVGLANYASLARSPDFWRALRFSAEFALANVAGSYLLGLGLALLLNAEMPCRAFLRVFLLLPWIIPSVVSVVSWRWLVADEWAPVNLLLQSLGVAPVYFLSSDTWAQIVVFTVKIWRSFPFMMLSLLAAMQGIDRALYEAGAIDGATAWQSFRAITLPHLRGISVVMWILMTIWTINDFETPWLITQGGPSNATENLIVLAFRYTFAVNRTGPGTAVAFVTFVILTLLALVLLRLQRRVAA
jgi:multiple sugar transport system permease protein